MSIDLYICIMNELGIRVRGAISGLPSNKNPLRPQTTLVVQFILPWTAMNQPWRSHEVCYWESMFFFYLVVSTIFYFHPYLGKISHLTNIFQMGWNHQLVLFEKGGGERGTGYLWVGQPLRTQDAGKSWQVWRYYRLGIPELLGRGPTQLVLQNIVMLYDKFPWEMSPGNRWNLHENLNNH